MCFSVVLLDTVCSVAVVLGLATPGEASLTGHSVRSRLDGVEPSGQARPQSLACRRTRRSAPQQPLEPIGVAALV
jgi:hypothetical protein